MSDSSVLPTTIVPPFDLECLPNYDLLVTEDDTPVDIFTTLQARLLSDSLHVSWSGPGDGRPFQFMSNV